jgi:ATP-dependent helicase/nuclease subunit A
LDLPEFFVESRVAKATDIGTATHLAMEHWDFSSGTDSNAIERQIQALVDRKIISAAQGSRMINRESIGWLLKSNVGKLLKKHSENLMREIPFVACESETAADGLDRRIIRGRIDLLFETKDGWVIVDYKTDNISSEELQSRATGYRAQMQYYRDALAKVAGVKIDKIYLVFLTPREILEV